MESHHERQKEQYASNPDIDTRRSKYNFHIVKPEGRYFQRAGDFLIDRVGGENIISAVVRMDEKTPHLHLTFVPLTEDNRLCAKEIIGNRKNLMKWQDDFFAYMVEKYPDLERGESASKTLGANFNDSLQFRLFV